MAVFITDTGYPAALKDSRLLACSTIDGQTKVFAADKDGPTPQVWGHPVP
ncbi:hypothetical protein [Arthrobacter sp. TWP1-1]